MQKSHNKNNIMAMAEGSRGRTRSSGMRLLWQQYRGLMRKNAVLSWRSKTATLMQLASSILFLLLLFCCDKALQSRFDYLRSFSNDLDPKYEQVTAIPPCEDGLFIKKPCYDFLWSGNSSSPAIRSIVASIMNHNPGRPIPSSKVLEFDSASDVDAWLEQRQNKQRTTGAIHLIETSVNGNGNGIIGYGIQTNSTSKQSRGYYEDPTFTFQLPLQVAAERAIARYLTQDSTFSWTVGLKEFAHPATATFSIIGKYGPTFLLATVMFGFVIQLGSLIAEREFKLRQAMSIMGLYDSVYWLAWLTWEGLLTVISATLLILFGMMFQFNFFLKNSFSVLFLMFFLFQLNMTGMAFMLSAFISKSSSATNIGFFVYIIGFLTQLVTGFGFPYTDSFSKSLQNLWSLFPPNLFAEGLNLLGEATATKQDDGISWSTRSKCPPHETDCVITLDDIFKWLSATFFVWSILAVYFDNTLPNVNGVRKSWFYFFKPSYWSGKAAHQSEGGGCCSCIGSAPQYSETQVSDEDVADEERNVKQQIAQNTVNPEIAVQVQGLVKTFPGIRHMLCCCRCKKTAPYTAVKGLWVNIEKDKLFCLLGPNGAGKTTTINCLTGITPITDGDALVYGHSVRSMGGMSNIKRLMGVCPQFDILWNSLSAKEHLFLFASIKGMPEAAIEHETEKLLSEVKLHDVAHIRVGNYSGGMKRRLSVAIALVGNPKLVVLDEPTTGMDPVTRRHVWDIIQEAKKGRAIVLTTHSMEEADILGDRISIMARGKLRCIGTSIHLKSRFGTGFMVNVSVANGDSNGNNSVETDYSNSKCQQIKAFFKDRLDVEAKEINRSRIAFVIPREKEEMLAEFFGELEERETEFGVRDIQVGLTRLDEVFLNIAAAAEVEAAQAEGRSTTLTLPCGTQVQVPIGAKHARIPGKDTMVEVYWSQDENGALCIDGHSDELPVPATVLTHIPEAQAQEEEEEETQTQIQTQTQTGVGHPRLLSQSGRPSP